MGSCCSWVHVSILENFVLLDPDGYGFVEAYICFNRMILLVDTSPTFGIILVFKNMNTLRILGVNMLICGSEMS